MVRACPVCGEENPARARFCLGCGTTLAAVPSADTRKVVTVLEADVVGFTSTGEQRDPEAVRRVMTRYFDAARAVVARHGGVVEKLIGDAVVAVFGLPQVHEDDALRAVRAAADLQEELARLRVELAGTWAAGMQVRTGIATGEVLAGASLVAGQAVTVAVRLEQAAAPGEIVIAPATYRLVQDAVEVGPVEVPAGGSAAEPLVAYRLDRLTAATTGRARRSDVAFVGRRQELNLVWWAFERSVRERTCHLFTILGTAGVGKSRLVREFLSQLGDRAATLSGRCLPYGEGITFWPVAEIVRQAAGIVDDDDGPAARAKLLAVLGAGSVAGEVADRVTELIGMGGEDAAPAPGGAWAVRKLLETLARRRPLVVVIDDLQWAEPTLLDLVDHVAEWSREAPILLVAVARPELLERRQGWGGGKRNATSVLLEPLPSGDATTLLDGLLGGSPVDDGAREHIVTASGGNPLYLEELLAKLVEQGQLRQEGGRWVRGADGPDLPVPATIQALLAARLDLVEPAERAVLERAAVVGEVFDLAAVTALSPPAERPEVFSNALRLVRKELLRAEASRTVADDVFAFRHLLVRDVVYGSMPRGSRASLHERFADLLTAGSAGHEERGERVAYHLEQAVECRAALGPLDPAARERARRAAELLAAAGRRAENRGDYPASRQLLRRSIALRDGDDPENASLLVELAGALIEAGDFDEAEACLVRALALADATGQRRVRTYAELNRLWVRSSVDLAGWAADASAAAEHAVAVFDELGDAVGLSRAWALLAEVHWLRGRFTDAEHDLRHAGAEAERAGHVPEVARQAAVLCHAAVEGPCPVPEGIERCRSTLARFGDRLAVVAQVERALAALQAMQGRPAEADRFLAASVERFTDLGQTWWLATTNAVAGQIALLAGDRPAAEAAFRSGLHHLQAIGETSHVPAVAASLAGVLAEAGRLDEAAPLVALARRTAATDDVDAQVRWRLASVRWRRGQGSPEAALAEAEEAVALARTTDASNLRGEALLALGETLAAAGERDRAVAPLREALGCYERKGNTVAAGRARTALAGLAGDGGAAPRTSA